MKVTPAPSLIMSSENTVDEVIEAMIKNNSSYVLLVDHQDRLRGIFTEHDLLLKFSTLKQPAQSASSIHNFMTHPVKTLPVDLMHTAPEFMIKEKVRHIAIVAKHAETGNEVLCGIVTRRQLFEEMVRSRDLSIMTETGHSHKHRSVGVISPDGTIFHTLHHVFEQNPKVDIEKLMITKLKDAKQVEQTMRQLDGLVLDVEGMPVRLWEPLIKHVLDSGATSNLALLYTSKDYPDIFAVIRRFDLQKQFHLYEKPIDIGKFLVSFVSNWN